MCELPLLCVGQPAPDFSYMDKEGTVANTRDLANKTYVVYFYPKDDTPGCTKQACAFRDLYSDFSRHGISVIGVSPDNESSHQKFRAKYDLPFALASDDHEHRIAKAYGVWGPKSFLGRRFDGVHRVTFLVSKQGLIAGVYPKLKPEQHATQLLKDTTTLHYEHP